jgi:hypothetical protein
VAIRGLQQHVKAAAVQHAPLLERSASTDSPPRPPTGLPTFKQPRLPADLNAGFPDRYISKGEGEASPVDTIVEAAGQAGVDWQVGSLADSDLDCSSCGQFCVMRPRQTS